MRRALVRIAAMLVLAAASAGCGGYLQSENDGAEWSAFIVAPPTPVFPLVPNQPVIVIVEFVPVNGFFLTPPVFFNDFIGVNPGLAGFCPSVLTIGNPVIGSPINGFPVVEFPLLPIGVGTCAIPLDLGMSGIVTLNVQVSSVSAGSHQAPSGYIMTMTKTLRLHRRDFLPKP
jgi:hypothetical protein